MQKDLLVLGGGGGGGGGQCSKSIFLFSYMFNTKSSCFSPKIKLYMYRIGGNCFTGFRGYRYWDG